MRVATTSRGAAIDTTKFFNQPPGGLHGRFDWCSADERRWSAPEIVCAEKLISRAVSSWFGLSSRIVKNILLYENRKSWLNSAIPRPSEGRIAIVTTRGAGCGGRVGALGRSACQCGRWSRVVL